MDIDVIATEGSRGKLRYGALEFDCALGKAGITLTKREGDHATPAGRFPLLKLHYRADKFAAPPVCALPMAEMERYDGWCDDPAHECYNQYVRLPFGARHEQLWRKDDDLYDLVVILGYNTGPVIPGAGSCIFLHVARDGYGPTEGCVALEKNDLLMLLAAIPAETAIYIHAP